MQRSCLWRICLIGFAVYATVSSLDSKAGDLDSLRVMQDQYPRVFFFRAVESLASNPRVPYERWDETCRRLMGIQGKVLDEEIPGRSKRNIDFFTRFKAEHPDQLVLLHYNGNSRDPRFETEKFFAGHFIYYNGAKILEDVPAEAGETEIKVDNPALFQTEMGRYKWSNDDIGLCDLDDEGRGSPISPQLAERFSGDSVSFSLQDGRLSVAGDDAEANSIRFQLSDVPAGSPDLFISVTVDAQQRKNLPPEIARRMWVGIAPPRGQLTLSELPTAGICLRGQEEEIIEPDCGPNDNSTTDHAYWADVAVVGPRGREGWTAPVEHMTWLNARQFTSTFYFKEIRSESIDLRFSVEGAEPSRSGLRQSRPTAIPTSSIESSSTAWSWQTPRPGPTPSTSTSYCPAKSSAGCRERRCKTPRQTTARRSAEN